MLAYCFYCCLQVSLPVVSRCFWEWSLAIAGSISPLNWGLLVPTFTWSLRSVTCCPSWVSRTQQSNDQMMYINQYINQEWIRSYLTFVTQRHDSSTHHYLIISHRFEVNSTFGSRSSVELAWNAFHHLRPSEAFGKWWKDAFGPFGCFRKWWYPKMDGL